MNNIVVASFSDEQLAVQCLHKLDELAMDGDIAVTNQVILRRNANSEFEVLEDEREPETWQTVSGLALGELAGLLEQQKFTGRNLDSISGQILTAENELKSAVGADKEPIQKKLNELQDRRDKKMAKVKADAEKELAKLQEKLESTRRKVQEKMSDLKTEVAENIDDKKRERIQSKIAKYEKKIAKYETKIAGLNTEMNKVQLAKA